MANLDSSLPQLSDRDLLAHVTRLAEHERRATALLVASLAELDARRLYLGEGCSSLFTYCTQVLHLSEHAAYSRIEAARAARRFPMILDRLADSSLTLTAVGLLARHLTPGNHLEVLDAAIHRTKREVEHLVARLRPRTAVPSTVRKLPEPRLSRTPRAQADEQQRSIGSVTASGAPCGDSSRRPAPVSPLAPERYKVQFTVGRETHEKLRRAQNLLRHAIPSGDPAAIFDRALTLLLADLEKARVGATNRPARVPRAIAGGSRHVPAAVRRRVWARDDGRCAFVGTAGRCTERGFLEFHHVVPYAAGGEATVENTQLRCRAHNAYEAEQYFGPLLVRESGAVYSCNSVRTELEEGGRLHFTWMVASRVGSVSKSATAVCARAVTRFGPTLANVRAHRPRVTAKKQRWKEQSCETFPR